MSRIELLVLTCLVLPLLLASSTEAAGRLKPSRLVCEYLHNPLGIDSLHPRFSWIVESPHRGERQSAYQLLVATDPALLAPGKADLWDSGRVASQESVNIPYSGKPLVSRLRCYWSVRVWDSQGAPSALAGSAFFEMGLLNEADWTAKWIGEPYEWPAWTRAYWFWHQEGVEVGKTPAGTRYFRAAFSLASAERVRLFITADNRFVAYVNGAKVGETVGSGETWRNVQAIDISQRVVKGENVISLEASNDVEGAAGVLFTLQEGGNYVDVRGLTSSNVQKDGWNQRDFDDGGWSAVHVIGPFGCSPWGYYSNPPRPAPILRRSFATEREVKTARLHVTALGSYQVRINGQRVGDGVLTPDWTDYRKRINYQTYDVTKLLKKGQNAIAAIVGDGWYASHLGWGRDRRFNFGVPPVKLLAQLHLAYADGSTETVGTDANWKWTESPIRSAEIYAGELFDARLARPGWDAGGDDSDWPAAAVYEDTKAQLVAQQSPVIKITQTIQADSVMEPKPGVFIFDLKQNMVGWARIRVKEPAGSVVRVRYAEMLEKDGTLYRTNLRGAEATDTYICSGKGEEVYEPHFTYHGFRYVEVTGISKADKRTVEGRVLHTAATETMSFRSSSDKLNRLAQNITWGLRGNLHSVPTDCPQRDERLGWMGDANAIAFTACYEMDLAGFFTKWMHDVRDAQSAEGGFSDVSPRIVDLADGAPTWGDAGVAIPYAVWQMYGDTRIIEQNYEAMAKWIEYIRSANPDLLWMKRRNNDFGDWVAAGSNTPKDVIATAWFARDAWMMARMSKALGRAADAKRYEELFDGIKAAFVAKFVSPEGLVHGDTQTCYVLALYFDLLPINLRAAAGARLVEDIRKRDWHLSTGFVGTAFLMQTLFEIGQTDVAYRLMLQETYPSWLYTVDQGATTIWERWDGWRHDKGFQDPGMNSFNHYAFGAVGEWLYRHVAGISFDPAEPGFAHVYIRPVLGPGLTSAKATYRSLRGDISVEWTLKGEKLTLAVTVPANVRASIQVPSRDGQVMEGSKPARDTLHNTFNDGAYSEYEVGGGTYRFESRIGKG